MDDIIKTPIKVFAVKNDIFTTSLDIAKNFSKDHKNVLSIIRDAKCSAEFSRLNFKPSNYEVRGKSYPMFNITKDGFMFLVLGFTGEKAERLRELYIGAFNQLEKELNAKVIGRSNGKQVRHYETDVIKDFIDYAEAQGSENAIRYYTLCSNLVNKALGVDKCDGKNFRDGLNANQLMQLSMLELKVASVIRIGIADGVYYKDIYQNVKSEVNLIASVLGRKETGVAAPISDASHLKKGEDCE
jgi:Rha family phage regulatory protein